MKPPTSPLIPYNLAVATYRRANGSQARRLADRRGRPSHVYKQRFTPSQELRRFANRERLGYRQAAKLPGFRERGW